MSHQKHRGDPPPSKASASPGISVPSPAQLLQRIESLEKKVQEQFDEKNNWNSEVRGWIGKLIHIQLMDGSTVNGELRWMDRYTLCINQGELGSTIVHKGAIALLRLRVSSDKL